MVSQWSREGEGEGGPGSPRTPPICQTKFFSLAIKKQRITHVSRVPQKNIHRVYLIVPGYCLQIIMFNILSYLLHLIRFYPIFCT